MSQEKQERRDAYQAEKLRREAAEPSELNRAVELVGELMKHSKLSQFDILRNLPEPRIIVLGGDAAVGPQVADVIKAYSLVDAKPHGQYLGPKELNSEDKVGTAFAKPVDLVMLPFTIDQFASKSFSSIANSDMETSIKAMLALPKSSLILVTTANTTYHELLAILGLRRIQSESLGTSESATGQVGQLDLFEKGDVRLTPDVMTAISKCDCKIGNVIHNTIDAARKLLIFFADHDLSSLGDEDIEYFLLLDSEVKSFFKDIASRHKQMHEGVPALLRSTDSAVHDLGQAFADSAEQFPSLLALAKQASQSGQTLVNAHYMDDPSMASPTAMAGIYNLPSSLEAWLASNKPIGDVIAHNQIYQAYRIMADEKARQQIKR